MARTMRRIAYRLFEPVNGASIAVFRMLFGAIGTERPRAEDADRPQVDLTEVELSPFRSADWIEPLDEPLS